MKRNIYIKNLKIRTRKQKTRKMYSNLSTYTRLKVWTYRQNDRNNGFVNAF